tara:strand:- start:378 stop:671 length:294 start_codon:yes stop_codon:yes gene_type:complete
MTRCYYIRDDEKLFHLNVREIVEDKQNQVNFPEFRDLSDKEIEYLEECSYEGQFDFSDIDNHYLSELDDDVFDFESGTELTERICEHLSDWLDDYKN